MDKVRDIITKIENIEATISLLEWDMEVMSPSHAKETRGKQIATLQFLKKFYLLDETNNKLLKNKLKDKKIPKNTFYEISSILDEVKDFEKLPNEILENFEKISSESFTSWEKAKLEKNYFIWEPKFKEMVEISRKYADCLKSKQGERYEVFIGENGPCMTLKEIDNIFLELKEFNLDLYHKIKNKKKKEKFFNKKMDIEKQKKIISFFIKKLGFDIQKGRQDISTHPFTVSCGKNDVRFTTNLLNRDFFYGFYSIMHECGHALYEQGMNKKFKGGLLSNAPDSSIHEAIARMFENQIGKSKEFIFYFLNILKSEFKQFKNISEEDLYGCVNRISPHAERDNSDEVSYDLHILMRYEIERELVNGNIETEDIPRVWNNKVKEYFGKNPIELFGCMQDVHWSQGLFGNFPTYTIGNIYASQILNAYENENLNGRNEIKNGNLNFLISWLDENIFNKGYTQETGEIIKKTTKENINIKYYKNYLTKKYTELYDL